MLASDRLQNLPESQTISLTEKVRELKAEGNNIIGLTLGEPDFDTPDHIRQAAIHAISDGFTHYPPVAGIPDLRKAIAQKFNRDNSIPYEAKNIVVSTGAKQCLMNVILSLVNPDDEAILIAPYWVSYSAMLKFAGAKIKVIETHLEDDFKVSPDQLEQAITKNTKLIIFNSPSNPTGSMYTPEEIREIGNVIAKNKHVFIISDEIYEYISYGIEHKSLASIPEIFEQVITINGLSKGFAMTGWRLGYMGASEEVAALCDKLQGQTTSGANSITQKAAIAALTGDMYPTWGMRDKFRERRDQLYESLKDIDGLKVNLPEGAFYFYPDVSSYFGKEKPDGEKINNIDELCEYLLVEGHVAVIPGTAFGTDKHIRISYAYSIDLLEKAASQIKDALSRLN